MLSKICGGIESVLQQSFVDFEWIVIHDGSLGDSVEIFLVIDDSSICLLRQSQNQDLVASLNMGLLEAKGQFISIKHAQLQQLNLKSRPQHLGYWRNSL